jgi:hypothetical protein
MGHNVLERFCVGGLFPSIAGANIRQFFELAKALSQIFPIIL